MNATATNQPWSPGDAGRDLAICFYELAVWGPTSLAAENMADKIVEGRTIIEDPAHAVRSIEYALSQGDAALAGFDLGCSVEMLKAYLRELRDQILAQTGAPLSPASGGEAG
jgi:hypothetical protein